MYSELLAKMRVLSMYYQTGHWQVKNAVFYSDHLLLERLYGEASSRMDQIAEKGIGVTGDRSVVNLKNHLAAVMSAAANLPTEAAENSVYFQHALALEQELQSFCKVAESSEQASMGCRNMLGDIADESEARIYLLKQRLSK